MSVVYVVSLEWNTPGSEVCGDPGIVSVHTSEDGAKAAADAKRASLAGQGHQVFDYVPDCPYCEGSAEITGEDCEGCGDDDPDPDEWDVDVHVTAHEVRP